MAKGNPRKDLVIGIRRGCVVSQAAYLFLILIINEMLIRIIPAIKILPATSVGQWRSKYTRERLIITIANANAIPDIVR